MRRGQGEGGCRRCGHPVGYHWPEDEKCTARDCDCPGYDPPDEKSRPCPLPE